MVRIHFEGSSQRVGGISQGIRGKRTSGSPSAARRAASTLEDRADRILTVAKANTPVSEKGSHGNPPGHLRDSGEKTPVKYKGSSTVEVTIEFPVKYAWPVHENMHANHKVGGPKFLEKAYLAERRGTLDALEEDLVETVRDLAASAMLDKLLGK